MAEKWRVAVVLGGAAGPGRSGLWRCKREVAREMQERSGGAVIVAGAPGAGLLPRLSAWLAPGESPVSAYTDNRAAAEEAARVAREVTGQYGLTARVTVECWHAVKRQWADPSQRNLAEEHDDQQREDRRRSAETGVAQWRVRVELRTHRDAVALAQRLSTDGHQVSGDWKSVVAGADSEDDARRLAEDIRQHAPPDADVHAERADTPVYSGEDRVAGPADFPGF